MTVSETAIANIALTFLGATPITSRLDEGTEGKIVNIHYDHSRDAALEAREWTFAVKRAELAPLQTGPAWGYTFAHALPADTLRLMEVRGMESNRVNFNELMNPLDWRREGNSIVSDMKSIMVRYLARIEDPNMYTSAFVQVVAARLAMDMAIGLTQSRLLFADMAGLYGAKLREAAATDGMQGRTQVARSSRLTGVRGIGASVGSFTSGTV